MNAVIGMAGLLLDLRLPPEALDYVQTIQSSSDSLLTILNDILDLSKIESGKLQLERLPFNLHECLESAADLLGSKALVKSLDLAIDVAPSLPEWIFGVTVSARRDGGGSALSIAMRDTGAGIPPERLGLLFQSFSQLDSSTARRFGGTGLGLCISKHLTEMMGGGLTVESVEGMGSTFTLTMPYEAAPALEAPPALPANWAGKRVLGAARDSATRRSLAACLSAWGLSAEWRKPCGWVRVRPYRR